MDIEGRQGQAGGGTAADLPADQEEPERLSDTGAGDAPRQAQTGQPFLTVIIPAYNEERRLPQTLQKTLTWLEQQPYRTEVLVVDDGSEDGTRRVVEETLDLYARTEDTTGFRPHLKLIANAHRGKAYAVRTGMLEGQGKYLLFTDADLSTPIEDFDRLLAWLEKDYDVAIGSREGQGARRFNEPYYRHLMGRVFNLLVKTVTFSRFQDTQCGFKAFTREAAQVLFTKVQLYGENSPKVQGAMVTGFDVEVLFLARKLNYRVREVPVRWFHVSGSKVNPVKDSLRMIGDISKVRLNDMRGLYKK
ncbi:MAG: glycosyltransferase family 2 protein [Chloroflexi bacterium]|nr:glycosyltransferase family 2 protein [Chloroflexota bacterium]